MFSIIVFFSILPLALGQYYFLPRLTPARPIFQTPIRVANNLVKYSQSYLPFSRVYGIKYPTRVNTRPLPTQLWYGRGSYKPLKNNTSDLNVTDHLKDLCVDYKHSIELFQKKLYLISFETLAKNNRQENGVSFVQSGVLLYLATLALSLKKEENPSAKCILKDKISVINYIAETLPRSDENLKLYWSSRLVLASHLKNTNPYLNAFNYLKITQLNSTNNVMNSLNAIIEKDSFGTLTSSFDDNDFKEKFEMALLSSVYFRCQWRASPTLLNSSVVMEGGDKEKHIRAIKINDIMRYADLPNWNAEAIEIQYATKGLSFLAILPRDHNLTNVVKHIGKPGLNNIIEKLKKKRVSVSMPVYTLRMTLLLPEKLRAVGFSDILKQVNTTSFGDVSAKITHGVQGVMFWSEAGRNAYKDDGLMWDEEPDMELSLNRPYAFFVRWKGITVLSGNFVY